MTDMYVHIVGKYAWNKRIYINITYTTNGLLRANVADRHYCLFSIADVNIDANKGMLISSNFFL